MIWRQGLRLAAVTVGLVLLPTAAFAQEAETGIGGAETQEQPAEPKEPAQEDQTGIGEADAVECTGTVAVSVVDLDGAAVNGALLSVAGSQVDGSGSVPTSCGEVGVTLLSAPEGYAPADATTKTARVRNGATEAVAFVVDEVEVLGVTLERPADDQQPAPQPETTTQAAQAEPEPALPRTGPEDAPRLVLLALLCAGVGAACLRVGEALSV